MVEMHAGDDLDGDDRCDRPINHQTEAITTSPSA
jgi:hypothetical protein